MQLNVIDRNYKHSCTVTRADEKKSEREEKKFNLMAETKWKLI